MMPAVARHNFCIAVAVATCILKAATMTLLPSFLRRMLAVAAAIVSVLSVAPALAAETTTLRVMLHPDLAARGTLPADALAHLEAAAETTFTLRGTTRTGALDLVVGKPLEAQEVAAITRRLQQDRGVLWVQPQPAVPSVVKRTKASPEPQYRSRRLMVRLQDGVAPDWANLLPRMAATVGQPLTVERQIADIWVLSVPALQTADVLAAMAERLQQDGAVRFADPVRRAFAQAAPNDPFFSRQWSLTDAVSGINIEDAWTLQPSATSMTVAVIDTGILPHPDLAGRVLPGYDFISDAESARDGNGRDPDPRDEGDWTDEGECFGYASPSFFHGLFVAGQIAANTNNGIGIAGVAGNVNILPVRVLGKCGGSFEDIVAGTLWASGVNIGGVPPNTHPARVINLSLGGFGTCDQALQESIDDALTQGSVIVAAAGNESLDVSMFAPANCGGVISVSAHNRRGTLTEYSNFGTGITLSAPGGDLPVGDLVYSTAFTGTTVPEEPTYMVGRGTSFSAPLVSGVAALILARNPLLTGGRVQDIIAGTTRKFPTGSICSTSQCGSGMLDAAAAVGSTFPNGPPPPNAFEVVEFYRADLDHYFISASPIEINYIDRFLGGIFQRTGLFFYAYLTSFLAPPGVQPVCRFYADANVQINSHYYTADQGECAFVQANWPGIWQLEQANAFYIQVPDLAGNCPAKTLPVYRFFNNRRDANHRYTVDLSQRRAMLNRAWAPEGNGSKSVAFCSPI